MIEKFKIKENKLEEDRKIFEACDTVRSFILLSMDWYFSKYDKKNEIKEKYMSGSVVSNLISEYNWDSLLENKDWINALEMIQNNLNAVITDKTMQALKFLKEKFPEETKGKI